jgi:CCR4-NOT transcription complex subunit 3
MLLGDRCPPKPPQTWITNSDIKDKRPLTDARKLIETEMERFKVCEKEFKTKAFSKEGLSQQPKEDPKEKEKNRVRKWISEKLETLASQVDAYEVEIENQNSGKGKKSKKESSSVSKWETLIERVHYHEEKLEVVLRLLDNETLSPEDIEPIQDQLDYLLEQMTEGNTDEVEMIDDDQIYEELGVEDEDHSKDEAVVVEKEEKKPNKDDKKGKKEEEEKKEKKKEKPAPAQEIALPTLNAAAKATPIPKPSNKEPVKIVPKPAAAAATIPPVTGRGNNKAPTPVIPAASPARPAPRVPTPAVVAAPPAEPTAQLFAHVATRGKEEPASPGLPGLPGAGRACGLPTPASGPSAQTSAPAGLPACGLRTADSAGAAPEEDGAPPGVGAGAEAFSAPPAGGDGMADASGPALLPRGVDSAPGAGSAQVGLASRGPPADFALTPEELEPFLELSRMGAPYDDGMDETMHTQMLALSLANMPEPGDSERPKTYVPRNPYPTPSSFPQSPATVFDKASAFDKFDADTLFFIFYYQQGTYQQFLAARELKKQSWRYHKKYLTWFQRHEEPKLTADDYEQGTYVYFDYETGWCQRIKSEFTFEYRYLEDELQLPP